MEKRYTLTELNSLGEFEENLGWEVAKAFPTDDFKQVLLDLFDNEDRERLGADPDFLAVDWSAVDDYGNIAEDYSWRDCVDWNAYNNATSYDVVIDEDPMSCDDNVTIVKIKATNDRMIELFIDVINDFEYVHHYELSK